MKQIDFDAEKHQYTVDGKAVPSVTTILDYVTAKHYGAINPAVLRQAADRGSAVHEATEALDYGFEPEIYPEIAPYITAYENYLNDFRPETVYAEKMVYSENGGYCGTIDRVCRILGDYSVLDIKTTASPTRLNYISYCAQTYAYEQAIREEKQMPAEREIRRFILFLKKDGNYRLVDCGKYEEKHKISGRKVWELCAELYKECEG